MGIVGVGSGKFSQEFSVWCCSLIVTRRAWSGKWAVVSFCDGKA